MLLAAEGKGDREISRGRAVAASRPLAGGSNSRRAVWRLSRPIDLAADASWHIDAAEIVLRIWLRP